jgi:hypothetical protein
VLPVLLRPASHDACLTLHRVVISWCACVGTQQPKLQLLLKVREALLTALEYKNDCTPALALWSSYLEVHVEVRPSDMPSMELNGARLTCSCVAHATVHSARPTATDVS